MKGCINSFEIGSLKNMVIYRYETELKRYRNATFLEEDFEGTRKYDKEIIAILKRGGVINSYRLLEEWVSIPGKPTW